jgi:2-haloalkanoic acid dehalogenase type II
VTAAPDLVTFDCYGTLVDWEGGMRASLEPIVRKRGQPAPWETLTGRYIEVEMEVEAGEYRPYREVQEVALARTFEEHGIALDDEERKAFARSIRRWPPFPETREALTALRAAGKKLAILSNIDDDIIRESVRLIGVPFDWIVTAEQTRTYKPHTGHWKAILEVSGLPRERILHVAASALHDVIPASALGFRTVWINRNGEPADLCLPERSLPDLRGLPALV